MKKFTLLALAVIVSFSVIAQTFNWQEQLISPNNNLKEMSIYDNAVTLVGYGRTFVKSTDTGETWNDVPLLDVEYDFGDISITDDGTGYACAGDPKVVNNPSGGEPDVYTRGLLLKTTDNGATWQHADISGIGTGDDPAFNPNAEGCYTMHFYAVEAVSADTAFIGLQWYWWDYAAAGKVTYNSTFMTIDGGVTWQSITDDNKTPYAIEASNSSVYLCGSNQLLKVDLATTAVTDIYPNLVAANSNSTIYAADATVVSKNEVYISSTSDGLYLTVDEGQSFTKLTGTGVPTGGNDLYKVDENTILVLGTSTKSKVTIDGGLIWTNCYPGATCYEIGGVVNDTLYGLGKSNAYKIAVADLKTGTSTWVTQTLKDGENMQKMHVIDGTHAVIAGYGETIVTTSDGGLTWDAAELPKLFTAEYPEYDWSDVSLSYLDGTSYASTRRLYFINYPSSSPNHDVYGHGLIAKSTDNWETWSFLDYRNIGAGETDPSLNPNLADACYGMSPTELECINDSTLYAYITWLDTIAGYDNKLYHSRVFKTIDSGDTWTSVTKDFGSSYVTKILFDNISTGYIVGNTIFLKTIDGGQEFIDQYPPLAQASIDAQNDSTLYLTSMHCIDNGLEWYFTSSVDGVFETHDGGIHYSMLPSIGGGNGFYKVNDSSYVVLGSSTKSKVSFDRGATWTSCYPGSTIWKIGGVLNNSLVALAKSNLYKIPLWNLTPPEKDILSFVLDEQDSDAVIDADNHTIAINVVPGTDPSSLKPLIEISEHATISPDTSVAQDFTSPVVYTVTGWDESTQEWTVTVTVLVSVNELEENSASFYPNPVKNTLYIKNADRMERLVISSVTGMTLLKIESGIEPEMEIDLGSLRGGIYFISFYDKEGKVNTKKLIKE